MPAPPIETKQVGILVLDDDPGSQGALRQILDSESWRVRVLPDPRLMMTELATGEWALVIANIGLMQLDSPTFITLKELASVPADQGALVRVLFLIPEMSGSDFTPALERDRLPYVVRPYNLHDFLEKVSDLLLEIKAIENPIRQVRHQFTGQRRKKAKGPGRETSMFAARESYSYSEEELAEYEKSEDEQRKKKGPRNLNDLGNPRS